MPGQRVRWENQVVDNEGLGKKKSKSERALGVDRILKF